MFQLVLFERNGVSQITELKPFARWGLSQLLLQKHDFLFERYFLQFWLGLVRRLSFLHFLFQSLHLGFILVDCADALLMKGLKVRQCWFCYGQLVIQFLSLTLVFFIFQNTRIGHLGQFFLQRVDLALLLCSHRLVNDQWTVGEFLQQVLKSDLDIVLIRTLLPEILVKNFKLLW